MQHCLAVFPSVDYAFTTIPTYPSGQIGFLLCSTSPNVVLREPSRTPPPALQQQLRYYSPAVHAAAFVPDPDSNPAFEGVIGREALTAGTALSPRAAWPQVLPQFAESVVAPLRRPTLPQVCSSSPPRFANGSHTHSRMSAPGLPLAIPDARRSRVAGS